MKIRLEVVAPAVASLGGLVVGCGISWSSPVIPRMPFHVTKEDISWMVSMRSVGTLLFAFIAGKLNDRVGRKPTLVMSGVPGLIGWLMIAFTRNVPCLLVARFLIGVETSLFSCATPIYIAEVADKRHRGWMITLMSMMLNLGQMFEYMVGPYVSYRDLALMSAAFPAIFLILMIFMPESPMFYVMNNRLEPAQIALSKLRGRSASQVDTELERTVSHVSRESSEKCKIKHLVRHKGPRRALLIVLGLFSVQHLSGLMAILMYTEEIFAESKSDILSPEVAPIIISISQAVASFVCGFFTDKTGRRPLLMLSTTGCGVSLVLAGILTFLHSLQVSLENVQWLPIAGIMGYFVMFNVGIGPLVFVVEGELFPPNMKGLALSLCSVYIGILDFIITKTFPHLQDMWGQYVLFWIFAAVAFAGTIFVYFCVPETKGKTLSDIVDEMKGPEYQLTHPHRPTHEEPPESQETDEPPK